MSLIQGRQGNWRADYTFSWYSGFFPALLALLQVVMMTMHVYVHPAAQSPPSPLFPVSYMGQASGEERVCVGVEPRTRLHV
jgi:hypothetical protein